MLNHPSIKAGKSWLEAKKNQDMELSEALKLHDDKNNPKGESLHDNQRVYRVKVICTFCQQAFQLATYYYSENYLKNMGTD